MSTISKTPWKIDDNISPMVVVDANGVMVADCGIFHKSRTNQENLTNVKLILVAPALLELAKEIVKSDDLNAMKKVAKELIEKSS